MPPKINQELCDRCGQCLFFCPEWVIGWDPVKEQVKLIKAQDCVECFTCVEVCPNRAVELKIYLPALKEEPANA